jgi:hypothetical protein
VYGIEVDHGAKSTHPLVAPEFDLALINGRGLGFHAWEDRITGLGFGMLPSRDARPRFYLADRSIAPEQTIVLTELQEVSRTGFPRDLIYTMSKSKTLGGAQTPAGRRVVEALGGEDRFFDYCLKAVRACHCRCQVETSGGPPFSIVLKTTNTNSVEIIVTD